MLTYLLRRTLIAGVTLLLITFIVYGLIRSMPGDPVTIAEGDLDPGKRQNPADRERMIRTFGLDLPWYEAYFVWLGNVARFDLGRSISQKAPVWRLIGQRVGPTLILSVPSLLIAYLLSIPMGLYASVRNGRLDERMMSTFLYMLYSFPIFVAALLMQIVLAVRLDWLPLMGIESNDYDQLSTLGKVWDVFLHSLMPVACETYGSLAYYSRFVRSNMLEVLKQDYIRTAKAKGVGPTGIITHHALRNTLIPLVTLVGLSIASLISGGVIIEQTFTWPGMGRLFFESIAARDYPTIMGLTLLFSMLTLAGTLLADMMYAVVDPRVTYS